MKLWAVRNLTDDAGGAKCYFCRSTESPQKGYSGGWHNRGETTYPPEDQACYPCAAWISMKLDVFTWMFGFTPEPHTCHCLDDLKSSVQEEPEPMPTVSRMITLED